MADNKVRVAVPKERGDEIRVSYAGDPPVTYQVTNGHVEVDEKHVDAFLSNVEGATKPESETPAAQRLQKGDA